MASQETFQIHSPTFSADANPALDALRKGFGHRSPYDTVLITAAAQSMLEAGGKANTILEVCCGYGELLAGLATTFPDARIVGMDQHPGTVEIAAKAITGHANAEAKAVDVMHLDDWDDGSVDLIIGQATMHHLTHNLGAALGEFARVLRRGGKCMFTFEPLSHNHIVNVVRSFRNAKDLLIDESNLYIDTIEMHASKFSSVEIQCFNLTLSYLFKALPARPLFLKLGSAIRKLDSARFRRRPKLLRKAANFNVIFTK